MKQPAQMTLLTSPVPSNDAWPKKVRKKNPVWKLLTMFEAGWSPAYSGEVYARGGRDLKAAKDFLELYPDFFDDEILQSKFSEWRDNYLRSRFWYKPTGNPPLYHPFWGMILHLDKCMAPTKRIDKAQPRYSIVRNDPPPASKEAVHGYVEKMKKELRGEVPAAQPVTQDPVEIRKIIDQQFPKQEEQ